jgi:hypothetical protein
MICSSSNNIKKDLGDLFNNRSPRYISSRLLKKFQSVWDLVDRFDMEQELRVFLSQAGDCKNHKFLFASIFFNYHTPESINYIRNAVNSNNNLQGRDPSEFAFDLIVGWIFELFLFKNFGLSKSGCDSDYILQKGKNIHSGADFQLNNNLIELAVDNHGVTLYKNHLHLRYHKWNKILKDKMFLFVLCPNDLKYFLHHSSYLQNHLSIKYLDAIPAFSKFKDVPGHCLSGWQNIPFFDLNKENLKNSFNELKSK